MIIFKRQSILTVLLLLLSDTTHFRTRKELVGQSLGVSALFDLNSQINDTHSIGANGEIEEKVKVEEESLVGQEAIIEEARQTVDAEDAVDVQSDVIVNKEDIEVATTNSAVEVGTAEVVDSNSGTQSVEVNDPNLDEGTMSSHAPRETSDPIVDSVQETKVEEANIETIKDTSVSVEAPVVAVVEVSTAPENEIDVEVNVDAVTDTARASDPMEGEAVQRIERNPAVEAEHVSDPVPSIGESGIESRGGETPANDPVCDDLSVLEERTIESSDSGDSGAAGAAETGHREEEGTGDAKNNLSRVGKEPLEPIESELIEPIEPIEPIESTGTIESAEAAIDGERPSPEGEMYGDEDVMAEILDLQKDEEGESSEEQAARDRVALEEAEEVIKELREKEKLEREQEQARIREAQAEKARERETNGGAWGRLASRGGGGQGKQGVGGSRTAPQDAPLSAAEAIDKMKKEQEKILGGASKEGAKPGAGVGRMGLSGLEQKLGLQGGGPSATDKNKDMSPEKRQRYVRYQVPRKFARSVELVIRVYQDDKTTLYNVLGVGTGAEEFLLKKVYRARALQVHPDKNPHPDAKAAFDALQDSFNTLANYQKRADYDKDLQRTKRRKKFTVKRMKKFWKDLWFNWHSRYLLFMHHLETGEAQVEIDEFMATFTTKRDALHHLAQHFVLLPSALDRFKMMNEILWDHKRGILAASGLLLVIL